MHNVNGKLLTTYDNTLGVMFYSHPEMYIYGTAENIGRLCYALNESIVVYTDLKLYSGGNVIAPESLAYEVWCGMIAAHGNKRGRKPACSVYLKDSVTGEVVKHFRYGGGIEN